MKAKSKNIILINFLLLLFIFLPIKLFAQDIQAISAIVNDEVISRYDVQQRVQLIVSTSGIKPTQENIKRLETQALRSLVNEKIQLQEAIKLDVPSSEDEVNLMLERIANGNQMSGQEILQQINSQGVRAETLLNQIKAELLWNKIVRGRYGSYINVNEDEVSIVKSTTSEDEKELNSIGIFEDISKQITLIEWPEIIINYKINNILDLYFEYDEDYNKRFLTISSNSKINFLDELQ